MVEVAVDYFQTIFHPGTCERVEDCLNTVPQRMSTDMREELSRPYIVVEVVSLDIVANGQRHHWVIKIGITLCGARGHVT